LGGARGWEGRGEGGSSPRLQYYERRRVCLLQVEGLAGNWTGRLPPLHAPPRPARVGPFHPSPYPRTNPAPTPPRTKPLPGRRVGAHARVQQDPLHHRRHQRHPRHQQPVRAARRGRRRAAPAWSSGRGRGRAGQAASDHSPARPLTRAPALPATCHSVPAARRSTWRRSWSARALTAWPRRARCAGGPGRGDWAIGSREGQQGCGGHLLGPAGLPTECQDEGLQVANPRHGSRPPGSRLPPPPPQAAEEEPAAGEDDNDEDAAAKAEAAKGSKVGRCPAPQLGPGL
jgi:hypothetical protein